MYLHRHQSEASRNIITSVCVWHGGAHGRISGETSINKAWSGWTTGASPQPAGVWGKNWNVWTRLKNSWKVEFVCCILQSKMLCCDNGLANGLAICLCPSGPWMWFFQVSRILVLTKYIKPLGSWTFHFRNFSATPFHCSSVSLCFCLSHCRYCGRSTSILWLPASTFSSELRKLFYRQLDVLDFASAWLSLELLL